MFCLSLVKQYKVGGSAIPRDENTECDCLASAWTELFRHMLDPFVHPRWYYSLNLGWYNMQILQTFDSLVGSDEWTPLHVYCHEFLFELSKSWPLFGDLAADLFWMVCMKQHAITNHLNVFLDTWNTIRKYSRSWHTVVLFSMLRNFGYLWVKSIAIIWWFL